jgi:hypothetical protein
MTAARLFMTPRTAPSAQETCSINKINLNIINRPFASRTKKSVGLFYLLAMN